MNRYRIENNQIRPNAPSVIIVTQGEGALISDGCKKELRTGDYFFMPAAAKDKYYISSSSLIEFVECLPSLTVA